MSQQRFSSSPSPANEITARLLDEIPKRFREVRVWRNNRVKAVVTGENGRKRMMDAGIDGQADISGIAGPSGRRVEIEVKAGRDRLRPDQIAFRNMILSHGGIYIEARGVEAGLAALAESLNEGTGESMQSAAQIVAEAGGPEEFLEQMAHPAERDDEGRTDVVARREKEIRELMAKGLKVKFVSRWCWQVGPLTIWPAAGQWANEETGRRGKLRVVGSIRRLIEIEGAPRLTGPQK